jgi:outer membrane lipoprotein SlyB
MKTKQIQNLDNFTGTILIPVFETNAKSIIPIEYHGISVPSKVFYGKKVTHYVVEKLSGAVAGGVVGAVTGGPLGALTGAAAGDQLTDGSQQQNPELDRIRKLSGM